MTPFMLDRPREARLTETTIRSNTHLRRRRAGGVRGLWALAGGRGAGKGGCQDQGSVTKGQKKWARMLRTSSAAKTMVKKNSSVS